MYEHLFPNHRATIERVKAHFRSDPRYRALMIGGSIIKGLACTDSDVDIMLIPTEEEYARLASLREFTLYRPDLSTYEGGYVDGKYLDYQFLLDAAERGSEPTRWSFKNAIIVYSDIPDLETLIAKIAQYPLHEQPAKIRSFFGQFFVMYWFVGEAEKRQNIYLKSQAIANMVLYGSRLILAHNQMLYPYHKWMMAELARAPEKPDHLIELANALLRTPNNDAAKAFFECVTQFRDWGVTIQDGVNAFAEDSERSWMVGRPALVDW